MMSSFQNSSFGDMMSGSGGPVFWLVGLLVIVGLIVLVIALVRR